MRAPAPHSVPDLEARVLGAAMTDRAAAAAVAASLPADRFTEPKYADVARALVRIAEAGHAPTYEHLLSRELAGERVDVGAVCECHAVAVSAAAARHDVDLLNAAWQAREFEAALFRAHKQADDVRNGRADLADVAADVQRAITAATMGETAARDVHIASAVEAALARTHEWEAGHVTDYAPSGFYSFDRHIGGYPVGELTTLAAMTGAGKTALLCQIVRSVALQGDSAPVVVFSAEMSAEQIAHRVAAGLAGVNLRDLRRRSVGASEYARYRETLAKVAGLSIHVDDAPSPSFAHIRARLEQVRTGAPDGRLALVAVDYDEKIDAQGASEELRVSAIARGLKNLAKEYAVAVFGLSQYSRSAEPHLPPSDSWLRYSGKKEQESAMIVHWHWPRYWIDKGIDPGGVRNYDPMHQDRGQLVVTKNRFGRTGAIDLDFDPTTTSFRDVNEPDPGTIHLTTYPDAAPF